MVFFVVQYNTVWGQVERNRLENMKIGKHGTGGKKLGGKCEKWDR